MSSARTKAIDLIKGNNYSGYDIARLFGITYLNLTPAEFENDVKEQGSYYKALKAYLPRIHSQLQLAQSDPKVKQGANSFEDENFMPDFSDFSDQDWLDFEDQLSLSLGFGCMELLTQELNFDSLPKTMNSLLQSLNVASNNLIQNFSQAILNAEENRDAAYNELLIYLVQLNETIAQLKTEKANDTLSSKAIREIDNAILTYQRLYNDMLNAVKLKTKGDVSSNFVFYTNKQFENYLKEELLNFIKFPETDPAFFEEISIPALINWLNNQIELDLAEDYSSSSSSLPKNDPLHREALKKITNRIWHEYLDYWRPTLTPQGSYGILNPLLGFKKPDQTCSISESFISENNSKSKLTKSTDITWLVDFHEENIQFITAYANQRVEAAYEQTIQTIPESLTKKFTLSTFATYGSTPNLAAPDSPAVVNNKLGYLQTIIQKVTSSFQKGRELLNQIKNYLYQDSPNTKKISEIEHRNRFLDLGKEYLKPLENCYREAHFLDSQIDPQKQDTESDSNNYQMYWQFLHAHLLNQVEKDMQHIFIRFWEKIPYIDVAMKEQLNLNECQKDILNILAKLNTAKNANDFLAILEELTCINLTLSQSSHPIVWAYRKIIEATAFVIIKTHFAQDNRKTASTKLKGTYVLPVTYQQVKKAKELLTQHRVFLWYPEVTALHQQLDKKLANIANETSLNPYHITDETKDFSETTTHSLLEEVKEQRINNFQEVLKKLLKWHKAADESLCSGKVSRELSEKAEVTTNGLNLIGKVASGVPGANFVIEPMKAFISLVDNSKETQRSLTAYNRRTAIGDYDNFINTLVAFIIDVFRKQIEEMAGSDDIAVFAELCHTRIENALADTEATFPQSTNDNETDKNNLCFYFLHKIMASNDRLTWIPGKDDHYHVTKKEGDFSTLKSKSIQKMMNKLWFNIDDSFTAKYDDVYKTSKTSWLGCFKAEKDTQNNKDKNRYQCFFSSEYSVKAKALAEETGRTLTDAVNINYP